MKKICTTIEQSQKLIELGIDIYTADMYWKNGVSDKYIQYLNPCVGSSTNIDYNYDVSAWSLSALLELIQDDIKIEKTLFDQSDIFTYSIIGDAYQYRSHEHENLLDAAFEMVCWLLENEKI